MIHITQAQLDTLIDELFAVAESFVPVSNILVKMGIQAAHSVVRAGADAAYTALVAKGVIATS